MPSPCPRHRRRRLRRLARRRRAGRRPATRCGSSTCCSRPRTTAADPAGRRGAGVGDLARPDVAEDAVAGVDAVCHQAADGRSRRRLRLTSRTTCTTTTWAPPCCSRALHRRGFAGRVVLACSMVVYGEGRYRCAEHGVVRPGPRARRPDCDAGATSRAARRCGARAGARGGARGRAGRSAQRVRGDEAAPGAPRAAFAREHGVAVTALRYHNVYGPRMPRDTPYAGVASIFRVALERGEAPRGLRGRRAAARLRARRATSRAPTCSRSPRRARPRRRSTSPAGTPRTVARHGRARWPPRSARRARARGRRRVPARRRPPRVRLAAARREVLGFRRGSASTRACASSPPPSCAPPPPAEPPRSSCGRAGQAEGTEGEAACRRRPRPRASWHPPAPQRPLAPSGHQASTIRQPPGRRARTRHRDRCRLTVAMRARDDNGPDAERQRATGRHGRRRHQQPTRPR